MTRKRYIEKKADDLRTGDQFVSWASMELSDYPEASRILNIKSRDGGVRIFLDNGCRMTLHNEHMALVEVLA